jgi:hypothetical protein
MRTPLTIIGVLLLAAAAHAQPSWAARVDADALTRDARNHWQAALERWDRIDQPAALSSLERAAKAEPQQPALWLALASAADEVAQRESPEAALDHLRLAVGALTRLRAGEGILPGTQMRADLLERAVERRIVAEEETLLDLTRNPPDLSVLGPSLRARPMPEPAAAGAAAQRAAPSGGRSIQVTIDADIGRTSFSNQGVFTQTDSISIGVN